LRLTGFLTRLKLPAELFLCTREAVDLCLDGFEPPADLELGPNGSGLNDRRVGDTRVGSEMVSGRVGRPC
jgi:hypothetical protein